MHQKCNADGNPIGRFNQKPFLDECLNKEKFPGGDMTESLVNIITELMFAQCDIDGNEYVLLESFIDYRKHLSALIGEDLKVIVKKPYESQQLVGTFVGSGKTAPHHG